MRPFPEPRCCDAHPQAGTSLGREPQCLGSPVQGTNLKGRSSGPRPRGPECWHLSELGGGDGREGMATALQAPIKAKAQLSLRVPYSRWSRHLCSSRLASRSLLSSAGKFLKTALSDFSPQPVVNGSWPLTDPGAVDCNTCPASFPPLPCCCGTGSPFLPGRSLGGKLVRLGSLPALGVLKGLGDVATMSPSSGSGFPDLKALRPGQAQAPTPLGAIPMSPALGSIA